MKAQSIAADQVNFEDTPMEKQSMPEISLLPGFMGTYQNAKRIEREARQLYTMSDTDLNESGISRDDIPTRLLQMYRA